MPANGSLHCVLFFESPINLRYTRPTQEFIMIHNWFDVHDGLAAAGRFTPITRIRERISVNEVLVLILCGAVAAAATGFIRLSLRIPGNAIILSVIPMALGLALAPRKSAGFIMSTGAIGMAGVLGISGLAHFGAGALTSLCLLGPLMDFALARARGGWRLYAGLILGAVGTSILAMLSRGAGKLLGFDVAATMRPFGLWWPQAIFTYALCGAVAGLIAALCFFQLRKQRQESPANEPQPAGENGKPAFRP
jgi:hypothetical protein